MVDLECIKRRLNVRFIVILCRITRNGVSIATDNSGNLMFFDTSAYVRSKGKEFDGFRVNINDLVK